jgi:nucleoside-triphosphatase THEP1
MNDSFSDITIFDEINKLKLFLEKYSDDVTNMIDFDKKSISSI